MLGRRNGIAEVEVFPRRWGIGLGFQVQVLAEVAATQVQVVVEAEAVCGRHVPAGWIVRGHDQPVHVVEVVNGDVHGGHGI